MDITTAKEMFNSWLAAEKAIIQGAQSYKVGDKEVTRVNMSYIRENVRYWENKVKELESNPSGRRGIVMKRAVYVG